MKLRQGEAPELEPRDYRYCATKGCPTQVPKLSVLLNKCPECNGDEYVELVRKQAIEKGVVSAQRGAGAKLPPGAKPDGDDKAGAGDKQLGGEARP